MKKRYLRRFFLCISLFAALFFWAGLRTELTVRRYPVESDLVTQPKRLVFLSDLHSCIYGEGQRELLELVEA